MLRRFSVFSLALLLCLSLFPARALADVGNASVLWSGSINDGAQFGAFVKGGTNYDAAVAALGYDSSRLSDEVKTKLADESYSGYFYTFATSFQRVSTPFDIPSWVPVFVSTGSVIADLLNNISGSSYPHWSVEVASVLYDLALRDFHLVLRGEDLSGGGSSGDAPSGVSSSYVLDSVHGYYPNRTISDWRDASGSVNVNINNVSYVESTLQNIGCSYLYPVCVFYFWHSGATWEYRQYIDFIASASPVTFEFSSDLSAASRPLTISCTSDSVIYSFRYTKNPTSGAVVTAINPPATFNATYTVSTSVSFSRRGTSYTIPTTVGSDRVKVLTQAAISSNSPVVAPPSGVWPEPDVPAAPVAPELPEPAEPVVETPVSPTVPAPVWPDITINIDNDPTPGTTPSGLDYTELLTRINDNLISIDAFSRAINSNLNSLRGDLLAEFNGVYDSLRNIYNYLLTIDSVLETHCTHLRNKIEQSAVFIANYMRTLIKWLADQLDYDDLTNVEAPDNSLLTTINEKLGGGTYEPNPIKDEQGYYEWLDDLWDRFLLGDNWQSSMGSISGSFSELKTRFPFSVPWDIVALFRLFVHDPVTPVFDLPFYFSADGSTPIHVDLSPWDSVASLVRPMIFVIFALKLALLSRDLLGGLGADKGGL